MKEQIEQIEALAEDILQEYTNCYSEVDKEVLAKMIYNAGYRKQSEGEWKCMEFPNGIGTLCGHEALYACSACTAKFEHTSKFCPNCGAHMKGERNG